MKSLILLFNFIFLFHSLDEKIYVRDYYPNKTLKSEGWMQNNKKVDYWFFYYENGVKKEEGHFENNKRAEWWIFYNTKKKIIKKCEFKNDKQDGFSVIYNEGEVVKAEKYAVGKKIKEWESITEFKKDNSDLF